MASDSYFYKSVADTYFIPMLDAEVQRPSQVMMFMDANKSDGMRSTPSTFVNLTYYQRIPHLEGGNVAFADGHVKWLAASNLATVDPGIAYCAGKTTTVAQYEANPSGFSKFCDPKWNPYMN
jgi:prepilin-type processing-associated H-X9-DG protein